MAVIPIDRPEQAKTKRRRLTPKEALSRAEERLARDVLRRIQAMERLAEGVWVEETLDGERRIVYRKPPDRLALQYLIDRAMGRPPQSYEVTGEGGGPIEFLPWLPSTAQQPEVIDVTATARELPASAPSAVPTETQAAQVG